MGTGAISYQNWYKNKDGVILGQTFSLGKETKLSYLSCKLLYTLCIEENVHFVLIKYLKELFDETGCSSFWINQDIPNYACVINLNRVGTP